jgi:hypothetical protein
MSNVLLEPDERRLNGRVTPVQRIRGTVGSVPVYVLDLSLAGVRVAHQDPLPAIGQTATLVFEWEGRRFTGKAEVRRTKVEKPARSRYEKSLHHSGLFVTPNDPFSYAILKDIIQSCHDRALDEQRANAEGIPAIAAQSVQTGKGDEFIRCELRATGWVKSETRDPQQPMNGFTISASETPSKIATLCRTWEIGDAEARRLIKTFAALSISKSEGIPTRRYAP